jgi:hypothetical protein
MSTPHNEEQPIIDAMERGEGAEEWWDVDADVYTDYLTKMDDLGIAFDE